MRQGTQGFRFFVRHFTPSDCHRNTWQVISRSLNSARSRKLLHKDFWQDWQRRGSSYCVVRYTTVDEQSKSTACITMHSGNKHTAEARARHLCWWDGVCFIILPHGIHYPPWIGVSIMWDAQGTLVKRIRRIYLSRKLGRRIVQEQSPRYHPSICNPMWAVAWTVW